MTFLLALAHALDRPDGSGRGEPIPPTDRRADGAASQPDSTRLEVVVTHGALVLSGEIDLSTRDLVATAADQVLAGCAHASCDVVLHMGGVSFIDAAGLGTLVSLSIRLAADGARLRIVAASQDLRRLSALCGLNAVLGLEPADDGAAQPARPLVSIGAPARRVVERLAWDRWAPDARN